MVKVRRLESVVVWGRAIERAREFAVRMEAELGVEVRAVESVREAVAEADVVCTLTSAVEPILMGGWVRAGTHVNVVGSSYAGPAEVDGELVRRSRFVVDSREGVLAQGAEFLRAKAAGLVTDEHIVGEIGQVLAGDVVGRQSAEEVTVYKSLGHVAQDLACAWALYAEDERVEG
jgi:ornithine cyclodeaminase/alanine dehydrogenase-like protein (mu-crystallin family)